jgi:hypothetical protein
VAIQSRCEKCGWMMPGHLMTDPPKRRCVDEKKCADRVALDPLDLDVTLPLSLLLKVLEALRLAPIYALKDHPEIFEMVEDFKPHKWDGYEREFAEDAAEAYGLLLDAMTNQISPDQ